MRKKTKTIIISVAALTLLCGVQKAQGAGAGTAAGLTLIRPMGARPAALANAFSAVQDDITAFGYNPASLESLESMQASFLYEKGMVDDTYGNFLFGLPGKRGNFGFSLGYYNAGNIDVVDENLNTNSTNAQTDLSLGFGYANHVRNVDWGVTGKYLSSKLIDQYHANGLALDLGAQMTLSPRFHVGAAIQNIGPDITYVSQGYPLPRIYRAGATYLWPTSRVSTLFLLDLPYDAIAQELKPAVGVEATLGPLALRGGYQKTSELTNGLTLGAGFRIKKISIDYAFGFADDLSAEQNISVTMRFGSEPGAPSPQSQKPTQNSAKEPSKKAQAAPALTVVNPPPIKENPKDGTFQQNGRRMVRVKPGDTLGKIAEKVYGKADDWKKIYRANEHILQGSKVLEVGQLLVVP